MCQSRPCRNRTWLNRYGRPQVLLRLLEVATVRFQFRQQDMGGRRSRIQSQQLPTACLRVSRAILLTQCNAQAMVDVDGRWVEPQGLPVVLFSRRVPAAFKQ